MRWRGERRKLPRENSESTQPQSVIYSYFSVTIYWTAAQFIFLFSQYLILCFFISILNYDYSSMCIDLKCLIVYLILVLICLPDYYYQLYLYSSMLHLWGQTARHSLCTLDNTWLIKTFGGCLQYAEVSKEI